MLTILNYNGYSYYNAKLYSTAAPAGRGRVAACCVAACCVLRHGTGRAHVFRYTITESLTLDRVCWSSSHHLPTFVRRSLQPRSSATAGHECRCACASCLCLMSVCLTNPIFVSAPSRHRLQERFYLSSFRYIEPSYRLPVRVSA